MTESPRASHRPANLHGPALAFLGLLGLLLVIELAWTWYIPLPFCMLRKLTGIPCPFCGGTRCLLALAHLEFLQALRTNPLVFAGCVGVAVTFISWLINRTLRRHRPTFDIMSALNRRPFAYGLGAAVLLNWIYLYATLPR